MPIPALVAIASAAAGAQQTPPPPAAKPAEKVRCHVRVETGTLAKTVKECHTPSEWQRMADHGREDAEYYRQAIK